MPRIRTIKPTFWSDEKVATLPRAIRLTFLGIISAMADDQGRCRANPRLVCAAIYPLDEDMTPAEICVHLDMLAETGLVGLYEVAGEKYLHIVNWDKHQKINRPTDSQLPAPPRRKPHGRLSEDSVRPPAVVEGSVVDSKGIDIPASGEAAGSSVNGDHRLLTWPVEGSQLWTEKVGPITPARFGHAMKPVVDKEGWAASKAGLECYIELSEGKARRVEWYANDSVRWIRLGKMPLIDPRTGALTERGKIAEQIVRREG
jgi:hypothetical protein